MADRQEIEINEEDVIQLMDQFTKVPPLLLKVVISGNSNVIKTIEGQIEDYKDNLSPMEIAKIRKVLDMPVPELREILNKAYHKTHQEQLKILGDIKAEPFMEKNIQELRKILFSA